MKADEITAQLETFVADLNKIYVALHATIFEDSEGFGLSFDFCREWNADNFDQFPIKTRIESVDENENLLNLAIEKMLQKRMFQKANFQKPFVIALTYWSEYEEPKNKFIVTEEGFQNFDAKILKKAKQEDEQGKERYFVKNDFNSNKPPSPVNSPKFWRFNVQGLTLRQHAGVWERRVMSPKPPLQQRKN
ncbi:hypothetical protein [Leptospira mayottensis]|uniref:Uncharacterized protein n=2 Tax=Leptospira mayottensis TaxID=1137606 RepID=A0AA87MNL2_9LEPT|nr:hypothetical protein [Leptospira mayottensis]AXR60922.1 hypothetical protein DQM68_09735 [Leptospira mayottensis]AXR64792.1 hypothetical protein DQM28_11765 [Leptospira mayottensis]AZQ02647.1 hypothetical protein LEP1GSC190_11960 [Leptospira mayottensis 200901116]EKR98918.1 hypothetical protein LEP1GSC125_2326 [Leptospira mayottensis 200901122]TGN12036.1 hypothetical protein EHR03_06095 [Leptospira mayottensis]